MIGHQPDKKELTRQYKQNPPAMGVYLIKNLAENKIFIGSSKNLPGVLNRDQFQLKLGSHASRELQDDYRRLGEAIFLFEVVDRLEPKTVPGYDYSDDLKALKQLWREKLLPQAAGEYR
jgi:hypothetical protein